MTARAVGRVVFARMEPAPGGNLVLAGQLWGNPQKALISSGLLSVNVYLVLRGADRVAGLGDSRHGDVIGGHRGLGLEAPERPAQFPVCCRARHPALATPTAFPGRLSTFVHGRPLHCRASAAHPKTVSILGF